MLGDSYSLAIRRFLLYVMLFLSCSTSSGALGSQP